MREAVVKRKDDEHLVFRLYTDHRMRLLDIGSIVSVSEEDTLRICSSS